MSEDRAICKAGFDVAAPAKGLKSDVHLLPLGDIEARDGRRWKLTNPHAVVAATKAHANGAPVAIDYDHQLMHTAENGRPAPAAGWMTNFEVRANGIWASVEWTASAADMLASRQYRFISPVFAFDKNTGEISKIYHAGLTNFPALTLTAVASAQTPMATDSDLTTQLRRLLDLSDTAPASAIIEAVKGLQGKAAASFSPDRYVPIEALEAATSELNRTKRGVTLDAAKMTVERAVEAGRLLPALSAWAIDLCTVNKPAFDSFIERTGGGMQQLFQGSSVAGAAHQPSEPQPNLKSEIAAALGHTRAPKKA